MKNQRIILSGISICLAGVILDTMLTRYAYVLIHLGTLTAVIGCIKWFRIKENRQRFKEKMKPEKDFVEMVKLAFDFSWARISIIWTICALGAMLLVHLGAISLRYNGAYKSAIQSIREDKTILMEAGEIIDFSYMLSGNFTTRGTSNINIGIIGSNKSLRVTAVVEGSNGYYQTKELEIR